MSKNKTKDAKQKSVSIAKLIFIFSFIAIIIMILSVRFIENYSNLINTIYLILFLIVFSSFLGSFLFIAGIEVKKFGILKTFYLIFLSILVFYTNSNTLVIFITFFVNVMFVNYMKSQQKDEKTLLQNKIDEYNNTHTNLKIKLAKKQYTRRTKFMQNVTLLLIDGIILVPAIIYENLSSIKEIFLSLKLEKIVTFVKENFPPYESKLLWYMLIILLVESIYVLFVLLLSKEYKILSKITEYHKKELENSDIPEKFSDYEIQYIIKEEAKEYSDEEIKIIKKYYS